MGKYHSAVIALLVFLLHSSWAYSQNGDSVEVTVLDIGPGLATVMRLPGDYYVVYDAGDWRGGGRYSFNAISSLIPNGEAIDLLVLSHTDSDHLGAVDELLENYTVHKILRTGKERNSNTWKTANSAIQKAVDKKITDDFNLRYKLLPAGTSFIYGDTVLTFVSGFHIAPSDWELQEKSERNNATSIVLRLTYKDKSILFTGDAVGRHIGGHQNQLIATEKYMVNNAEKVTIDSDVLIVPHHGADNGSSTKFINAVISQWIVVSAGHQHSHPRSTTMQRFLSWGLPVNNIFRTDLGDDENEKEWPHGRIPENKDPKGDNDIRVSITAEGVLSVNYLSEAR